MAKYRGFCGVNDVVVAEFNKRVHIYAEVTNEGDCPVKIRFGTSALGGFGIIKHFRQLTKTVQPGETKKADRDECNYVTISCDHIEDGEDPNDDEDLPYDEMVKNCRFTYSIQAE
jgi:hypothetical protein